MAWHMGGTSVVRGGRARFSGLAGSLSCPPNARRARALARAIASAPGPFLGGGGRRGALICPSRPPARTECELDEAIACNTSPRASGETEVGHVHGMVSGRGRRRSAVARHSLSAALTTSPFRGTPSRGSIAMRSGGCQSVVRPREAQLEQIRGDSAVRTPSDVRQRAELPVCGQPGPHAESPGGVPSVVVPMPRFPAPRPHTSEGFGFAHPCLYRGALRLVNYMYEARRRTRLGQFSFATAGVCRAPCGGEDKLDGAWGRLREGAREPVRCRGEKVPERWRGHGPRPRSARGQRFRGLREVGAPKPLIEVFERDGRAVLRGPTKAGNRGTPPNPRPAAPGAAAPDPAQGSRSRLRREHREVCRGQFGS